MSDKRRTKWADGYMQRAFIRFSYSARYMNISDEWETPEKQPFKDFVSIFFFLNNKYLRFISSLLSGFLLFLNLAEIGVFALV